MLTGETFVGSEIIEGRIKAGGGAKLANLLRRAFRRPPAEEKKIQIREDHYEIPVCKSEAEMMHHHLGG